ncbi:MAG: hypothetical protein ABSH20_26390, partial [Tepidisphaeraceae bacterium]
MRSRQTWTAILGLGICCLGQSLSADPVTLKDRGWRIAADAERKTLTVWHERTDGLLEEVQLNVSATKGLMLPQRWSVSARPHQLAVVTEDPPIRWVIEPDTDVLKISSTSVDGVLVARAPASEDRLVARLLEKDGMPVVWTGTGEVAGSYGGAYTRNPSALATRNPECMYFTLGPVSGSIFHSLFDRKTDTAIRFTDRTLMQRDPAEPQFLKLTVPVPGSAVIRLIPDYYTKHLGLPFYAPMDDSYFSTAPMVWGSWTSCYGDVTEADIVRNTDWIARHLKPCGFQYVQLDDGYDTGGERGHNWIDHWNEKKFPHGPKWLADYIKSKGLHPGLWIVPNAYSGAV